MANKRITATHPSVYPSGPASKSTTNDRFGTPAAGKSPRQPDWLLIIVSVLFLITLLIAWLVVGSNL